MQINCYIFIKAYFNPPNIILGRLNLTCFRNDLKKNKTLGLTLIHIFKFILCRIGDFYTPCLEFDSRLNLLWTIWKTKKIDT